MNIIGTFLNAIMTGLRAAITAHALRPYAEAGLVPRPTTPDLRPARPQPPAALFAVVSSYVGRTAARLDRLITRWQAGTLPTPRATRPRISRPAPQPPKPRLPRGRAWLAAVAGYQVRGHASQLNHLLARPDFAEFVAAAPQAARILRPLCHMLGIAPQFALPSRPCTPQIRPPRPTPSPIPTPPRNTTRPFTLPKKKISSP